ncbi:type I restriction enzyme HsdR N-terminal domain-containing protein [Penaeicola halotolerans]|uniref:type I restriction enzyme HsdR N-terminal domain-containing protein n=1 Tax=Penaeicola halotolerans TaxID=2793196 RepID=UPI001CF863C0|nr:type I restriction enzyme HsdR N-terminal domain-containing protein [Penaeicola halotolerans]
MIDGLERLQFPQTALRIEAAEGGWQVFDRIRKKMIWLTPEEWVRQHVVAYLIDQLNYPKALFTVEKGLKYNARQKRTDILVSDRNGNPYLLVECKAPEVKLSQKTVEQACIYNKIKEAKYLVLTNGLQTICLAYHADDKSYRQLQTIPAFDEE